MEQHKALKELLYKIADDQLILGHRNSEWTGLGPVLEEDIAFSSIAQDKVGQSWNLYQLLEKLGDGHPDQLAFMREEKEYRNCHLAELPIGTYEFSLMRHFLFDHAELIRFTMLRESSYEPLAQMAAKFRGEIKYHVFHANTWVQQLGKSTEEAHARMQSALNEAFPYALGIFEEGPYEDELRSQGIFEGEKALKKQWLEQVAAALKEANLELPDPTTVEAKLGGRQGYHTEYLKPLVEEMTEVLKLEPQAEW